MSWGLAIVNFDFISLHMISLDKIRQVTTFCELSVQMSTTIIFISPLDSVYRPYTADIEMMIILLFCMHWLKSIPCILKFEHIPLESVYSEQRRSKPQYSLWSPFSLLVRLFASITQRKFWIFILPKMHFFAF